MVRTRSQSKLEISLPTSYNNDPILAREKSKRQERRARVKNLEFRIVHLRVEI